MTTETTRPLTCEERLPQTGEDVRGSEGDLAHAYRRLFLAAPELLAACYAEQESVEHYRACEECDQDDGILCEKGEDLHERAEELRIAAIAKAEGRAA